MRKNYLREMSDSGLSTANIGVFPRLCFPYLGFKFFPRKENKVLDIGASQGHFLLLLKKYDWLNLWAADVDDFNRNFFKDNKINFIQIDIEKNRFQIEDCFFDVILAIHFIEHIKDPHNFLSEAHRLLKENGIFVLVTPDWRKQYKTFWHDPTHVKPYDKVSIARILRCYNFKPFWIRSYGVMRGIGRIGIWRIFKSLMFTGCDLIAVSRK